MGILLSALAQAFCPALALRTPWFQDALCVCCVWGVRGLGLPVLTDKEMGQDGGFCIPAVSPGSPFIFWSLQLLLITIQGPGRAAAWWWGGS